MSQLREEVILNNDGFCISNINEVVDKCIYLDGEKITTSDEWDRVVKEFEDRKKNYISKEQIIKIHKNTDTYRQFFDEVMKMLESEE